jgi:pterin-4a-carbinolamine dehydratase
MSHAVTAVTVPGDLAGAGRPLPPQRLKSERVEDALAAMGWKPDPGVRSFDRVLSFPAVRVAGAFVTFVAELAEDACQPCSVTLTGKQVKVTLFSRSRKAGPSEWSQTVLAFAKRLVA